MRLLSVTRYVTKSSENLGSLRSSASIACLVIEVIRQSSIAFALPSAARKAWGSNPRQNIK
jgi:hypothetical protein